MGVVMSVHGTYSSEHACSVSKWRPRMNLATECAEKVQSENLKLRQNDDTVDLRTKKQSGFICEAR